MNVALSEFRVFRYRFLGAVAYTASLMLVGTIGFAALPEYNLPDALYMTVITVSAVGYGEVQPLAGPGRVLAGTLIAGGIVALAIWFAFITSMLVQIDTTTPFKRRRMIKRIDKLRGHVIVCGTGRTGRHVIKELRHRGASYVAIEHDYEQLERAGIMDGDSLFIEGDATNDSVLRAAGIGRARGLVAALNDDADNVFVCLSARTLNPELTIVGRAHQEESEGKLKQAGADRIVTPTATGGAHMASLVLRPNVTLFLDAAPQVAQHELPDLQIEQMEVHAGSSIAGLTLANAAIPAKTGMLVVAIQRGEDRSLFVYNPGPLEQVQPGDCLIVLGRPGQIDRLRELLAQPRS